ncbi:ACP S-malonyltransferase [Alphaproteobacteria bacterium]|nr:ACP S-malonyltransferase [Alphaproteobacteria bacterium]
MQKTAFLFPGQGSQTVGMCQALAASSPHARARLTMIDEALGETLSSLMANGPLDELTLTRNAQPALFASSVAVLAALEAASGKPVSALADFVAGHSLGEYSALAAAGTLEIQDAAHLLRLRGDSMQKAVPVGAGAMAALLGADLELADAIVAESSDAGLVQIANDNAPGQIVVSGSLAGIEKAMAVAKGKGVRRALKLPVSAPFHCDLMAPAAQEMAAALATASMKDAAMPVICNISASGETSASVLRQNLVAQVTGRVRWRETLLELHSKGVIRFVEVGTGKVLSGLVKRTLEGAESYSLETYEDIESFLAT